MITVGPMLLNQPQAADPMEPFFLGTQSGGGYHTDMSRISSHDHSGGLMGAAVAVTIPDGSITAADLDPSVLAPYALVDGSKPFTGQVTMQADAVVRDALSFGQQGTALAPDVTLTRTGAGALRVDTHLGVGVNPASGWDAVARVVQVGQTGAVWGDTAAQVLRLASNTYFDGTSYRAIAPAAASMAHFVNGSVAFYSAPSVAAGAAQTFAARASIAPTGTLTLTPDASTAAVTAAMGGAGAITLGVAPNTYNRIHSTTYLQLAADTGIVQAQADNTHSLGSAGARWTTVYAVAGAINTSSQEVKEGITPLSPAECYQAAKDVRWYEYAYLPPTYTPPEPPPDIAYDAADDNETKAEKKAARDEAEAQAREAHLKMVAETAPARHQRGFVFGGAEAKDESGEPLPPVPELFGLSDRQSTTPQADLATLGCALQEVIRRLEQLEAPAA